MEMGIVEKIHVPIQLMCKKSGLELGLAQAAGPLGNLAARKS
jgi:hypothetical protein